MQESELRVPEALLRSARATRGRLRARLGARALARYLPFGVLFLTPWAVLYRFEVISGLTVGILGGLTLGGLILGVGRAVSRGPDLLEATLTLDRTYELQGRLAAALDYAGAFSAHKPPEDATGYMSLALAEARELGPLSPSRAAPLEVPDHSYWGLSMVAALVLLFIVPGAVSPESPPAAPVMAAEEEQRPWLEQDDAELLQEAARDLEEMATSEDGKGASERFNEIVLAAAAGNIDQAEAFRLAAELQAELESAGSRAGDFVKELQSRGTSLEQRKVTRAIGEALREKRFKDAEDALKKLAERLASKTEPLSDKELNELRESIEQMRDEVVNQSATQGSESKARSEEEKRLQERQKRLLQKKNEGKASSAEKREYEENERRLKRLSREKKRKEQTQKTLSDLDRQLAEAAKQLQKEREKSGEFLNKAAETLKQGVQKQLTDDEKRELIKQLKALKERLRRQNQDGEEAKRLREFLKRARGQKGAAKPPQGGGQGKDSKPGEMQLGPDGKPMPIPGVSPGSGAPGEGEGSEGNEPGHGQKPGQSHDPNLTGEESHLKDSKAEDTSAVAQDTGQGESASETILGVAEEGFTSSSYESLYREYQTVAEDVMEKETIPAGRRAHVRRYFELIRPRGATGSSQGDP